MEECGICFYEVAQEKFHPLECCQNRNRMCNYCLELLIVPLCPFCRTRIPGLPDKEDPQQFRGAVSLDSYSLLPPLYVLNPLDDSYLDSRILRRQMKRLRKMQERERHNDMNRRTNYLLNERKKREQQQKRDDREDEIKVGLDLYHASVKETEEEEEDIFEMEP
jgi:hypothetical protein